VPSCRGSVRTAVLLGDIAATCPFAASTSSENELICQRHTDTRRTLTQPDTQTAADKVLPATAPTYRICIKYKQ